MTEDNAGLYAFRRNLVLSASAGTGKTHRLVGVAVHLLLGACADEGGGLRDPLDPARLVATTFSRKAAAEIRARLVQELERLADADPLAAYRGDLLAACGLAGVPPFTDAELAVRAREALARVGRAQIGTLHSYAASLVRAHPLELGLSPGFALEGEAESRARAEDAITRVIESRAEDPAVARLAVAAGGVEPLVEQCARILDRAGEQGVGAAELLVPTGDAQAIGARMDLFVAHAEALVTEAALGEPARALTLAARAGDEEAAARALVELCLVPARGNKSDAAEAFFELRAELPGATNPERGQIFARLYRARQLVEPQASAARELLGACEEEIRVAGARDAVVSYGELLRAARDLLRDQPKVAAEVGGAIEALLVDEFQDTSRLQRELVQLVWEKEPEAREPGTIPALPRLRPRGLLVVGDRKQSIYGFRGADVSVFAELCVALAGKPAREALGILPGVTWEPEEPIADFVPLKHNRRAEDELLVFANAFSARRLRPSELPAALYEIDYVPEAEDLLPPPERPPSKAPAPRTTWLRVPIRAGATSDRQDEANVIARKIEDLLGAAVPLACRDLAVLARRHPMLDATAYALAMRGIPYVVSGRGFYEAREVRDVLAMLTLLARPEDKLALLEVLRGPWAGVHDETLLGLTDPGTGLADLGPAWDEGPRRALVREEDRAALELLRQTVLSLRRALDSIGPAEALREAVRALELEETLIQLPRGEQRVANVRKILAMAEREPSALGLLDRLRRAASAGAGEAEAATFSEADDAVRLLTMHASKGLSFPVVFVPEVGASGARSERGAMLLGIGSSGRGTTLAVRVADDRGFVLDTPSYVEARRDGARRDLAEVSRLLYVATTRASQAMFLVGDRKVPKDGASTAYLRSTAGILAELAADASTRRAAELAVEVPELPE